MSDILIPKVDTAEMKAFYLKMKGDYYRYMAEVSTGDEHKGEWTCGIIKSTSMANNRGPHNAIAVL